MDVNLYQSQKPIEHAKLAVRGDGIIILVMQCPDGPGGGGGFRELLGLSKSREEWAKLLAAEYSLGYHRISRNLSFTERGRIFGVSEVEPRYLEALFIEPFASIREALDRALEIKGPGARMLILEDSSLTVPCV